MEMGKSIRSVQDLMLNLALFRDFILVVANSEFSG